MALVDRGTSGRGLIITPIGSGLTESSPDNVAWTKGGVQKAPKSFERLRPHDSIETDWRQTPDDFNCTNAYCNDSPDEVMDIARVLGVIVRIIDNAAF